MKLLTIVPIYKPDIELLKKSISSYIDYTDQLIIWDNSPNRLGNGGVFN